MCPGINKLWHWNKMLWIDKQTDRDMSMETENVFKLGRGITGTDQFLISRNGFSIQGQKYLLILSNICSLL